MKQKNQSRLIKAHQPCPCGDSSDAYSIYDDGHGYCYSCEKVYQGEVQGLPIIKGPTIGPSDYMTYTYEHLPLRGITKETMSFFNVLTKINDEGKPVSIGFPYGNESAKVRTLAEKSFHSVGDMSNATLFGKERFSPGSARSITITEGELDALSTFQMLGGGYPVVSVRSASSARKDCERDRDYLNSFEKIYLCFDADGPGQKPLLEVAKLFDFNKVYHVKMDPALKDANGYLQADRMREFKSLWWNSRRFLPEGIISSNTDFDDILDNHAVKKGVPFPFSELHEKTYGIRTGETILFTAMEGIGKTEIIRAIEYHLFKSTNDNIGIIHLEENKARSLQGLAGYELGSPVHLPDSHVSNVEVKDALHKVVGRDERLHLYSHFGSSDPSVILDTIRFLVTSCGCKYVFLDHITMVVSGLDQEDERKALDFISTQLAMMVETLDFALIFVSHVNDEGKTRGSRNISKIADLWIHLDRDQQAASEEERNTTHLTIRKNRFAGRTGPCGKLRFDLSTYIISEVDPREIKLPPVEVHQ